MDQMELLNAQKEQQQRSRGPPPGPGSPPPWELPEASTPSAKSAYLQVEGPRQAHQSLNTTPHLRKIKKTRHKAAELSTPHRNNISKAPLTDDWHNHPNPTLHAFRLHVIAAY